MAKFVYRLQNVLDIKMKLETQAKTEFANASNVVRTEEEKMVMLINKRKQCQNDIRESSVGKIDVVQLKIGADSVKAVEELMKQQAVRLRIAEKNLERVREKLDEAMKDRKIHEKLKENAFEEFKIELNNEEKKEIDQLVSFTYSDKVKDTEQ
jgi:flagellar FliJ protein